MTAHLVTRFAPSPTGSLHLGNARTAFFSYLWARKSGGRFILRIEDTDVERSEPRFRDALMRDLEWLGLDWDEGPDVGGPSAPYAQSERGEWYDGLFRRLESEERAYACFCTPEELDLSRKLQRMAGKPPRYAGTCRYLSAAERARRIASGSKPTLRFAVPKDETIEFVDLVHGPQKFASNDIGDFIIRREDGTSAFFFCNAADDAAMGVTHVLRGDDHLTNTPRQLMLLDALGLRRPGYGHVGLLVGIDGAPLSKRHGSTSVQEFRDRGFLPGRSAQSFVSPGPYGRCRGMAAARGYAGAFPARASREGSGEIRGSAARALAEGNVAAHAGRRHRRLARTRRCGGLRGARAPQRRAAGGCGAVDGGGARGTPAGRAGGTLHRRCGGT